jgi:hypothetical protein
MKIKCTKVRLTIYAFKSAVKAAIEQIYVFIIMQLVIKKFGRSEIYKIFGNWAKFNSRKAQINYDKNPNLLKTTPSYMTIWGDPRLCQPGTKK